MEIVDFFRSVYGNGNGNAVLVLPNYQGKPTQDHWFKYPEQVKEMAELAAAKKTGDVWYSPNLFNSERRSKDNAIQTSVAGADADSCDPNNFRIQPTLTVQTSEGRWQVYWNLSSVCDPNEVAKLNRRIAQTHKNEGCDIAFVNAAKLMRVPGTSNNKHPGDVVIVADYDDETTLTLSKLEELYPSSEVPDVDYGVGAEMPGDLQDYIDKNRSALLSGLPNSIGLRDLLFGKFREDKRSDVRFKLLCELYRQGMDDRGVMAVAWGAPSNKYTEDPRGLKGLWDEAMRAKQAVAEEQDAFDLPIDSTENDKPTRLELGSGGDNVLTDFLFSEEREEIRSVLSFIDEWVQWAGTKTDAPAEYHRAAAMMIMSAVYSEFGHATPKFAKDGLKLNLWFMVLGKSTKDRKTTARSYANACLRALRTEDYNYSLGDDVTPSGISLALHDRANKASVFDRDEVQGLFKELLHQSYMSGGLEVFTKLYDGWSGGRIRSSGEKKVLESVPVSFIMFMMGILTETADVLTVTNYRSGFLTRFVYVIGKRPDDFKAPPMEQSTEKETEEDKVFSGLVQRMALNRNWWEMRVPESGKTYPLRADDDAWARLQQFDIDVQQRASESAYAEIIETTSARMVISTLKLAAILAMDDRSTTIKLPHVLQAISYAGEWFDNAVTVASMVSESEWQRDVDKLEQFINAKGGKVGLAQAYRAFKDKRPFEFEEMLMALESRGALRRTQVGSRWVLEIEYNE